MTLVNDLMDETVEQRKQIATLTAERDAALRLAEERAKVIVRLQIIEEAARDVQKHSFLIEDIPLRVYAVTPTIWVPLMHALAADGAPDSGGA